LPLPLPLPRPSQCHECHICLSMSTPQRITTGAKEEYSTTASARSGRPLRPLAPKPSTPSNQPALQRSRTAPSLKGLSRRFKSACSVCGQVGCRLSTHRAFSTHARSARSTPARFFESGSQQPDDALYTQSYGFAWATRSNYVDPTLAASKVDPFFALPVEDDKTEMHRLFFDCTTAPPVPPFQACFS